MRSARTAAVRFQHEGSAGPRGRKGRPNVGRWRTGVSYSRVQHARPVPGLQRSARSLAGRDGVEALRMDAVPGAARSKVAWDVAVAGYPNVNAYASTPRPRDVICSVRWPTASCWRTSWYMRPSWTSPLPSSLTSTPRDGPGASPSSSTRKGIGSCAPRENTRCASRAWNRKAMLPPAWFEHGLLGADRPFAGEGPVVAVQASRCLVHAALVVRDAAR
jgi:hypothetical protein